MTARSLNRFLAGAVAVASFVPGLALAAPTCAYVIGHVDGQTITTPALVVAVPSSDALAEPVVVHVDQTAQNIIGYSVTLPGFGGGTYGSPVFVPGVSQAIPAFSFTLPGLPLDTNRCVDFNGATIPAVPVRIPASALSLPGVTADVGAILFNIAGNAFTVPGSVVSYDGKQILIPEQNAATPGVPVGTPDKSITVDINGVKESARYLPPRS